MDHQNERGVGLMSEPQWECDECYALFTQEEKDRDVPWGHICKEKKFRKPIYCESYLTEVRGWG